SIASTTSASPALPATAAAAIRRRVPALILSRSYRLTIHQPALPCAEARRRSRLATRRSVRGRINRTGLTSPFHAALPTVQREPIPAPSASLQIRAVQRFQ